MTVIVKEPEREPLPPVLWKYLPVAANQRRLWLEKLVFAKYIFVPKAAHLNDPYEVAFRFQENEDPEMFRPYLRQYAKYAFGDEHEVDGAKWVDEQISRMVSFKKDGSVDLERANIECRAVTDPSPPSPPSTCPPIGILSLTSDPENLAMWSYYGDEFRGICIGFDTSQFPFDNAHRVKYASEPPVFTSDEFRNPFYYDAITDRMFFTKERSWSHEAEYRILFPNWKNRSHYPLDLSAIREIRLGNNISHENRMFVMGLFHNNAPEVTVSGTLLNPHAYNIVSEPLQFLTEMAQFPSIRTRSAIGENERDFLLEWARRVWSHSLRQQFVAGQSRLEGISPESMSSLVKTVAPADYDELTGMFNSDEQGTIVMILMFLAHEEQ